MSFVETIANSKPDISYASVEIESTNSSEPPRYRDYGATAGARFIHWKVPAIMASSLLAGLAFAIAHDLFYTHFDQTLVGNTSQQQWIIRGGSAFAFLGKLAWSLCCGTAFVQYFWLVLRSRPYYVKHIDSFHCALSNPLSLLNLRLWRYSPGLAIPVIVVLLLPLMVVITPGTIATSYSLSNVTREMHVPRIQLNVSRIHLGNGTTGDAPLYGAEDALKSKAMQVAFDQQIAIIVPPYVNSSYELEFPAPGLRCSVLDQNSTAQFISGFGGFEGDWYFIAWTPQKGMSRPFLPPFYMSDSAERISTGPDIDSVSTDIARLFIYIPKVIFECHLYNVSYTVLFEFEQGKQTVTSVNEQLLNHPVYTDMQMGSGDAIDWRPFTYFAVSSAFNRILLGDKFWNAMQVPASSSVASTGIGRLLSLSLNGVRSSSDPTHLSQIALKIQEMFRNITFSLLNMPTYLQAQNDTALTKVTITKARNLYSYNPTDLYITYGIALCATITCLAIGIYALLRNGRSYTNEFSTILRTTRDPSIGNVMFHDYTTGADPLPRALGERKMQFHVADDGEDGFRVVATSSL